MRGLNPRRLPDALQEDVPEAVQPGHAAVALGAVQKDHDMTAALAAASPRTSPYRRASLAAPEHAATDLGPSSTLAAYRMVEAHLSDGIAAS